MRRSGRHHANWRGEPSEKERDLLRFIDSYRAQHGYPPTLLEMAAACAWASITSVVVHLNKLEELGYVRRKRHQARSVSVLRPAEEPKD